MRLWGSSHSTSSLYRKENGKWMRRADFLSGRARGEARVPDSLSGAFSTLVSSTSLMGLSVPEKGIGSSSGSVIHIVRNKFMPLL